MRTIVVNPNLTPICIGKRGENKVVTVQFTVPPDWTDGDIHLLYQRPCDERPYPVMVTRSGNSVTWLVTSRDTARSGNGICELQLVVDDAVEKSNCYAVTVNKSMDDPVTPPDADENLIVRLLSAATNLHRLIVPPVEKLAPRLYNARIGDYDYSVGDAFFKRYKHSSGGCSAVVNGNIIGRNYDWTFDERCTFVTHTPAIKGRHAVLGVSAAPSAVTQDVLDRGESPDELGMIPFMLLDGINDAGLFAEINVVPPGDMGALTTGTNPNAPDLCAIMIPRFVLDNASSVDEAITILRTRNIYCAHGAGLIEEFHFLLCDDTKTSVIEFVGNEIKVIDEFVDNKPILTNLYLYGYDGTHDSLTAHAMGIERQAILSAGFDSASTEAGMIALMESVWYTKAYTDNWYSEFSADYGPDSFGDLTKDSTPEDYAPVLQAARALYDRNVRDGKTWQTVHTSVYDRALRKLTVIPQESGKTYTFKLAPYGAY